MMGFIHTINYKSSFYHPVESEVPAMLHKLEQSIDPNKSYTLGIDQVYEPVINYYQQTKPYPWLQPVNRKGINAGYDYYFVKNANTNLVEDFCLIQIDTYSKSKSTLYENCKEPKI